MFKPFHEEAMRMAMQLHGELTEIAGQTYVYIFHSMLHSCPWTSRYIVYTRSLGTSCSRFGPRMFQLKNGQLRFNKRAADTETCTITSRH